MKRYLLIFCMLLSLLVLVGCGQAASPYNEEEILGKTSEEIIALYGEFDCIGKDPEADGLYRSTQCGYTIREPKPSFLTTREELLFFIHFDEDGVAVECSTGPRPGG